MRIISRQSKLALLQVEEVMRHFPQVAYKLIKTDSFGDRHKEVSLMDKSVATDFFTRELDSALLDGRADIAIHSAKDLPYPLPAGIKVIALTESADKSDSLVTRDGKTLAELPAHSRVGTSSALRKSELLALRSDIDVVSIRGSIEERITQVDNGSIDALIVASCALERLALSHRASERLPFATHPLQGNLAITASSDVSDAIESMFSQIDIRKYYGRVTLIGFGPGDPELITVKGMRILEQADAIFYDDLTNEPFLMQFKADKVYVGKRSGKHSHAQDEINRLVYSAAISGKRVVRLKGGDAMIFAHGREEIDYLKSMMVEVDVVPGISSGIALASLTQIPLTHRGIAQSVAFVLGHSAKPQTPDADTLLYYMGGEKVSEIADALLKSGRKEETPVALVSNVSLPEQRTVFSTLGELRYAVFHATPVLIIVGEVVGLEARSHLQRVYNTGTQSDTPLIKCVGVEREKWNCEADELANKVEGRKLKVENKFSIFNSPLSPQGCLPEQEFSIFNSPLSPQGCLPEQDLLQLVEPCEKFSIFNFQFSIAQPPDWVVFTSRYGVRYYEGSLEGLKVASVGPVTSADIRSKYSGKEPDFESPTQSAEGLIEFFRHHPKSRILLPRSDKALESLSDGLRASGHEVTELTVYHNIPNPDAEKQNLDKYDKVMFTSPSTVEAFRNIYTKEESKHLLMIAKGKTTYETIQTI